jgi:hypothetical protein
MIPKNLRNYEPSQSQGSDAKASGGPISGQATPRTKAENAKNEMKEAYSTNCPKDNLGGKNTGS